MILKHHMSKETMQTVYASAILMITAVFFAVSAAALAEQVMQNTSIQQQQFVIMPRNCYLTTY